MTNAISNQHQQVTDLFTNIWQNYIEVTPSAHKIHELLSSGTDLINDHVAYRTFDTAKVNLDKLAAILIDLGYRYSGEYDFSSKKLNAKHFEHSDTTLPKVFISELRVAEFSIEVQNITKLYKNQKALNNVSFRVNNKSYLISFLCPNNKFKWSCFCMSNT